MNEQEDSMHMNKQKYLHHCNVQGLTNNHTEGSVQQLTGLVNWHVLNHKTT